MTRLAIIHTTAATVEPLKALAKELLPTIQVINFVDDSILPQLAEHGGDVRLVEPRLIQYALFAEEVGAHVILNACSSVGDVVASMQQQVTIPVVRIDEPMAEVAVTRGRVIGVAATLATTLTPTLNLLRRKAAAAQRDVEFKPILVDAAYQRLLAGDMAGHDSALSEALAALLIETDVIVLAQASMARVISSLPANEADRFLSSPRLGLERVRAVLSTPVD